jgi:hypothetical protein
MARFSSLARSEADFEPVENARVVNVLGEFFGNRLEELNTYSGRLTRCLATDLAGFSGRRLDIA